MEINEETGLHSGKDLLHMKEASNGQLPEQVVKQPVDDIRSGNSKKSNGNVGKPNNTGNCHKRDEQS